MVVEKSDTLRWVARQWGGWTERGVILNAGEMLRELHKMVGAALRKPRVSNEQILNNFDEITSNSLIKLSQ